MNILTAIKAFEKKHINLTIFIGIAIGVGVGMYLYAWLVPGTPGLMRMSDWERHGDMQHMMQKKIIMKQNMNGMAMDTIVSEQQFLTDMITHHEAAVRMSHQLLGLSSVSEQSAKLANDIIISQSAEIEMMKEWLAAPTGTKQ